MSHSKPMPVFLSSIAAGLLLQLSVLSAHALAGVAPNYQALWWKPSEPGWGVSIIHQGETLFATWFTYDLDGFPMWLVMSNGVKTSAGTYSGALYRTRGPSAFSGLPWNSSQVVVTPAGSAAFSFTDTHNGTFAYTVNGVTQAKEITRQIFASPVPDCAAAGTPSSPPNFQDLWWKSPPGSEPGWGVNIAHQGDVLFATWSTYDITGRGMWYVMSEAQRTAPATFTGTLYATRGPVFSAVPWSSSQVSVMAVGSFSFTFSDANNGVFTYFIDGPDVGESKAITRQVYASPATVCR